MSVVSGAELMLAAQRLPRGQAVEADIWRRRDQNGNYRESAERNAACEGVRDRVEFADGDARGLAFPTEFFDVIVSNLTIHNNAEMEERRQALNEAVRVLRIYGRLRIVDDRADRYGDVLREAGCTDVTVRGTRLANVVRHPRTPLGLDGGVQAR